MNLASILKSYPDFIEQSITDRFIKHQDVVSLTEQLNDSFQIKCIGRSEENRSIHLIQWGNGKTKILIWSQMHGDEPTGTMAIFDLLNLLGNPSHSSLADYIKENCTLYFIPMVNPDGAERFIRRNALQIDLNRDYLKTATAEARVLKSIRKELNPHFGFNLHDQDTLWSVKHTGKPATLSYLAPAYDEQLSLNQTRTSAMLVIADIFLNLKQLLPNQIGLFDDEHEPRAFGDNFQLAGMSTILIEAGGLHQDPEKQEIRKYFMLSILSGIWSIATATYKQQKTANYFTIPKNDKQIFHMLIHNIVIDGLRTSIGINYDEKPNADGRSTTRTHSIKDIGDLSFCWAYQTFQSTDFTIQEKITLDECANFTLYENDKIILAFTDGILG